MTNWISKPLVDPTKFLVKLCKNTAVQSEIYTCVIFPFACICWHLQVPEDGVMCQTLLRQMKVQPWCKPVHLSGEP